MANRDEIGASTLDLHLHSTASDGQLPPADVVSLAAQHGLRTIALTDHDSTDGIADAQTAGKQLGVEVIAGTELSTAVAAGELHMLGYLIDSHNELLMARLKEFRDSRDRRAEVMAERLNVAGVVVDLDRVRELAAGGAIGRPHVARALVESGQATSTTDAFERYLVPGRVGYVPHFRLAPVGAIELIHAAEGVAVLAHPFSVDDLSKTLPELVAAGLDGLEVFYSLYNDEQQSFLATLAERHGLVPTGGSDFHGFGEREGHEIGSSVVPTDTVDRLRDAARRRH
jgi:predicted metal-dependent phosphoesterase TrpH